ncbi:hypothetical protein BDV96DRAFT_269586 [Lophiotrema nucula]|uniref:Uncharacterized protein n=1 Tax=Lophiotrema nucula TaxID=690887 RepID=A0A6A5ZME3_9PLEO|nr:hypothetical protein BDV96DRAFT_269586 [Lophiotrema nucula]
MSPSASSRRADAVAPYARRKTRQPSRTGSDESGRRHRKWRESDDERMRGSEPGSCTSGSVTLWEGEEEAPIVELMEDIFEALDRLERRDKGKRKEEANAISIHHLSTRLSEPPPATPAPSPDLWVSSSPNYATPPPSYDDTLADLPPDYTTTDALAAAQTPEYTPFPSLNPSLCSSAPNCLRLSCDTSPTSSFYFDEKSLYADIDLSFSEEGIKAHAKKKKGAAAKKNASSWDDDEDKKKEEEAAGGSGGGDNGGGDPPADGGDGGAGGGDGGDGGGGDENKDDEWNDWDTGKKKKKKGRKAQQEEEEAERKKKEEEEEAERKKEEEDAAAAATTAGGGDLSWADQVENGGDDDWGFATAGKKKKNKKGKVRRSNLGCG